MRSSSGRLLKGAGVRRYEVTAEKFFTHPEISAVFACNDKMALGAVRAVRELAPHSVVAVGFDNSSAVQPCAAPPLHSTELGTLAAAREVPPVPGRGVRGQQRVPAPGRAVAQPRAFFAE